MPNATESRFDRHAELLVDHCTDIEVGDMVLISAPPVAEDLIVALAVAIGERGGTPIFKYSSNRIGRAYSEAMTVEDYREPEHEIALAEQTDVYIEIGGSLNRAEYSGVDTEKSQAASRARKPVNEILSPGQEDPRYVYTQYPAPGDAQRAEMSTAAYADFVFNAIDRDWESQGRFQSQLVEILEAGDEVRIVSGDDTDLRLSIEGRPAKNDDGKQNLPGGEVFTTPRVDSVEGSVQFDLPRLLRGTKVTDITLEFEDGKVVNHAAREGQALLSDLLEVDDGVRRLGELGFGMNRDIDVFTGLPLFDEKMGDTIHLALGMPVQESVDEDVPDSSVHIDLITDMSEDSFVEVDGDVIQRNGTFVFEDGFDDSEASAED